MNKNQHHDHPHVIAPPLLIFLAAVLIGIGLKYLWPVIILPNQLLAIFGILLMVLGAGMTSWAIRSFLNAQTNVEPSKPTTTIIKTGLFRYTRNPMYVSFSIVHLGIAILLNSIWIAIMLVPALLTIYYGVILREERYLEQKFGKEYLDYKASVRRWF